MNVNHTRVSGLAILAAVFCVAPALGQSAPANDPLSEAFRDPPQSARPRVWWHWMNGNITEDGIAKDIAWMQRVGIGGLQNFDASLSTPQIVKDRLVYMTPAWKKAFRFAAERADAAGLELAIAASPGWSETGGPWVKPEDAMKKVVWSELEVGGGQRFQGRLPSPPHNSGRFQSLASENSLGLEQGGVEGQGFYRDIAVFAIPVASSRQAEKPLVTGPRGVAVDAAMLEDGELEQVIDLGSGSPDAPVDLTLRYRHEQEFRAATLFMHDVRADFGDLRFTPVLEGRVAGAWRKLATFELSAIPTTVAFSPVKATEFRVVFAPYNGPKRPAQAAPAPGVIVPPFIAADSGPFSVKVAEFKLHEEAKIDRFEAKAGYSLVNDYLALKTSAAASDEGALPKMVLNLTSRMSPDGTLDWVAPKGRWRIIRLGWSLTGKTNHPAPPEATGLEVDKLDGAAVERYLRQYLSTYESTVGKDLIGRKGVRALVTDSTEVGPFNWTPLMVEKFRQLRGYDPTSWLPTLTGAIIGTRAQSDAFLFDYRRTLADLHASEHYATVARIAREYGLTLYGEALEDQRPVIGDDMAMRRYTDIPMAALWTWNEDLGLRPTLLGDMKGASSVGHLYGKNVIAAESMTSALAPWANAPSDLRRVIDLEFAHGINRPVIHTSVHQPLDDKKPGLSLMIFGQFFNRLDSWAEMARPWVDYMSRTSLLLQQGRNVADVAYFYGEEAPVTALTAFGPLPDTPVRYAYDLVNYDAVVNLLAVDEEGSLVAPSGARYRLLYLGGGSRQMTLPTLRHLAGLVEQGATLVGNPPSASPSLADDHGQFAVLVGRLWAGGSETKIGKGSVLTGLSVEAALTKKGLVPDVDFGAGDAEGDLMFVHRKIADGDIYFVLNRSAKPKHLTADFRVSGKEAELWHADTGVVEAASYQQNGSTTTVPLELAANESVFVLFRKQATVASRTLPTRKFTPASELSGQWDVSFQPERGAPPKARFGALRSLSENDDQAIRYFSGEATYTKSFHLSSRTARAKALWLDLGAVGDVAEVKLNGQRAGAVWHSPYRINITGLAKPGENHVEIKVANLWVNRLIGDAQSGATKVTFTTIPTFKAGAPLRPSGLIGPVTVLEQQD